MLTKRVGADQVKSTLPEPRDADRAAGGCHRRSAAAAAVEIRQSSGSREGDRISFFDFVNRPPHLETAFELVHRHLAKGDAVT